MIKAKIISFTLSESVNSISKLDLETYLEDPVLPNSFYGTAPAKGMDAVIMTEEEYESLEEVNKALDSVSDVLRKSLLDEREKTRKLKEEEKSLRKRLNEKEGEICKLIANNDVEQARFRERRKQLNEEVEKLKRENTELEAKNTDIRYDRTIINQDNTRLRRIVKEQSETIQKLEEENMSIKEDVRNLEKRMAQDAEEIDLHPDGTIVFRKKRISELEKEVENQEEKIMKLETENSDLKEKIETITRLLTPVRYDH